MIALAFLPGWWWLAAVLAVPMAGSIVAWQAARRAAQRRAFGARTDALLGAPHRVRTRAALTLLAGAALASALMHPVAGAPPGEPAQADVVFCLDLSRSMLARDQQPDRLGAAVADLRAFAEAAPGARAGLVAFAGSAHWIAPRTTDLQALTELAASLDPSRPERGGTDLAAALRTALGGVGDGPLDGVAVVLLTDGEDFAADAATAVGEVRARGGTLYAMVYGRRDGAKIVVDGDEGETFLRDASGAEVVSVPDRAALAELAARGGGVCVDGGDGALATLHREHLQPLAERSLLREPSRRAPHVFFWPLSLAWLLAMLALVIPERRR
ncbi:MAG: hypothetical protein RL398_1232 [Planctomycetota bacterium]